MEKVIAGEEEKNNDEGNAPEREFDEGDEECPNAPEETEEWKRVTEGEGTRKGEMKESSEGAGEEEYEEERPDEESYTKSGCHKGRKECLYGHESESIEEADQESLRKEGVNDREESGVSSALEE